MVENPRCTIWTPCCIIAIAKGPRGPLVVQVVQHFAGAFHSSRAILWPLVIMQSIVYIINFWFLSLLPYQIDISAVTAGSLHQGTSISKNSNHMCKKLDHSRCAVLTLWAQVTLKPEYAYVSSNKYCFRYPWHFLISWQCTKDKGNSLTCTWIEQKTASFLVVYFLGPTGRGRSSTMVCAASFFAIRNKTP